MARKNESGISYFPMNTDHHQNSKIKLLINDCGPVAYMVFQFMCSEGYNKDGYFFDASDEDTLTLFASDICKIPLSTLNQIISCCIKRKLFDGEMYNRFQILTSKRMQSNYLEAVKRRTTGTSILDKFNLIKDGESSSEIHNVNKSEGNVDRSIQNVAKTPEIVDSGTQNRIDKIIGEYLSLQKITLKSDQQNLMTEIYARHCRPAKKLLMMCQNDEDAIAAMKWVGGWLDSKNLTWTIETVIKHYTTFLKEHSPKTGIEKWRIK